MELREDVTIENPMARSVTLVWDWGPDPVPPDDVVVAIMPVRRPPSAGAAVVYDSIPVIAGAPLPTSYATDIERGIFDAYVGARGGGTIVWEGPVTFARIEPQDVPASSVGMGVGMALVLAWIGLRVIGR